MTYINRLIPIFSVAIPITAMAAPDNLSDWQKERGNQEPNWTISQLLGDDVIAGENTEVGEVFDAILDDQGNLESLVVFSNGNTVSRGFRTVDWPVKLFEPSDVLLSIGPQPSEFGNQQVTHSLGELVGVDQLSAGVLLGMGVHVDGSPYAEIEDLIMNEQGHVTSAVIDPDGMKTDSYWLPIDVSWINSDWAMIMPYSQSDIEQSDSDWDN